MEYTMLTEQDFAALRRERLATLEGEHYRLSLLLAETTSADAAGEILARQAEYERRIALHGNKPVTEGEAATDAEVAQS
jgi:hypothetical protein